MKIAMLTNRLSIGGGTEYIRLIVKHMPMHDFTVFALRGGTFPELERFDNVETVKRWPGRTLNGAYLEPCLAQSRKPIDVC